MNKKNTMNKKFKIYKNYMESHKEGYMIDFELVRYMKNKLQALVINAQYYKHIYGLFLIQRHIYEWEKIELKLYHNLENEIYKLEHTNNSNKNI